MNPLRNALANASSMKPATEPKVNVPDSVPKKDDPLERILTVNIKTMRTHMKNDNFNNIHTILELFAKVKRIVPPEEGKMKVFRLTLGSLEDIHPMEAIYYGDGRLIHAGDIVRCVGKLNGQTGQFKIIKIVKIDLEKERALIRRLEAISSFELAKSPIKMKI